VSIFETLFGSFAEFSLFTVDTEDSFFLSQSGSFLGETAGFGFVYVTVELFCFGFNQSGSFFGTLYGADLLCDTAFIGGSGLELL